MSKPGKLKLEKPKEFPEKSSLSEQEKQKEKEKLVQKNKKEFYKVGEEAEKEKLDKKHHA